MKRSQMVEILRNSFIEHMHSTEHNTDEEMYSAILKDLEKAGMLPPDIINTDKRGGTPIFINKWEDVT